MDLIWASNAVIIKVGRQAYKHMDFCALVIS